VQILVGFEGDGSGSGELSWGQREMWPAMRRNRSSLGIGGVVPLPEGATVEDVAAMVRFMISRHPSLRTRLEFGAGDQPRQVVSSAGEFPLEIVDTDGDPGGVAEALWTRYYDVEFDYVNEWPVRMAAVRHGGRPTHLVSLCSHLASDGFGLAVLKAELSTMDRAGPVTGMPPLEQARWQRSPAGRRQSEAALRYWENALRTIPARRFPGPTDAHVPPFWEVWFSSPAAHLAALAVAARNAVTTSAVLLAAFAVAQAKVIGINPVVTQSVVSNRFRPGLADSVSTVSHPGLCVVDADASFDEVVARAWRASLRATKNAYSDPVARQELINRVQAERGERIELSCYYNDRRVQRDDQTRPAPTAEQVRAAGRTTLRHVPPVNQTGERFFLHINNVPATVDIRLRVDTRHVSPANAEAVLRGMEAAVTGAATTSR
jgi:hypothetical protein